MDKVYYSYDLDKLVKNFQFVPYRLKRNANYEVGKTYWNSYWQKWYKVLEVNGTNVKILWQDGKIATHCTSLNTRRDYELKSFESFDNMGTENIEEFRSKYNPVNNEESLSAAEIKALCCAKVIDEFTAADLNIEYFDSREYRPNDYVYYFVWKERNYRGFTVTMLERDLDKSPRRS